MRLLQFPLICLQTHILENVELSRNLNSSVCQDWRQSVTFALESTQSNSFLANTLENLIPGFLKVLLKLFLLAYNQTFYLFFYGNDWKNKVKNKVQITTDRELYPHKDGVGIKYLAKEGSGLKKKKKKKKRTRTFLFSKWKENWVKFSKVFFLSANA